MRHPVLGLGNWMVCRRYTDPWTDQGVTELSDYELVE